MLLKLIPTKTNIGFIKFRFLAFAVSGFLMIASLGLFFTKGLNFGIDFVGGTLIEVSTEGDADVGQLRSIVGGLGFRGDQQIQLFGEPNVALIRIALQETSGDAKAQEEAQNAVVEKVKEAVNAQYPTPVNYRRIEVVGPKVSGELVQAGTIAILVAVGMMLLYIWFRFELQFSIGAVMALVHDVILTIGIFSMLQLDFTLAIIAALLTIVGYSMNDTVVVYDRVRENLRKYKTKELGLLLDESINDTLSRTTMTSVTTLMALFALFFLGGEVLRPFTFAMIWGVFVGTYSSIFVAAPLLLIVGVKRDWSNVQTGGANIQLN